MDLRRRTDTRGERGIYRRSLHKVQILFLMESQSR